jgi:hypothetical protein
MRRQELAVISLPGYDSWRSNADGYERPEYEDLEECALAQQGDTDMSTDNTLDIGAMHEWTVIQLTATRSRIDSELIRREVDLQRDLDALQRARNASAATSVGDMRGRDAVTGRRLKKDGTPYKTRSDKDTARVSRNAAASNDTSEDAEVAS